jgi:hypothetical protein
MMSEQPPPRDPMMRERPLQAQVEAMMDRHVTPALGEVVGQTEMAVQEAAEELRHRLESLSGTVRAQPITALLLAALAGFIVARLRER